MPLPTSLRGQLLLAVLLALAVAQAISAAITVVTRTEAVRAAQIGEALDRTAALIFVLDRTPRDLHANLLRATETPLTQLAIEARPTLDSDGPGLKRARRRLAAAMSDVGERTMRMALTDISGAQVIAPPQPPPQRLDRDGRMRRRPPPDSVDPRALTISLQLADGDWLNAEIRFPRPDHSLPVLPLVSFILAAAAIGVALWLTLGRMLGPLRRLAGAAERLGRGEEVGDLPATGPFEMRALTEAFNQMQQRLHRMVSDRTQMLAALGHDLRSPLTALRVRAEMVDDDETRERLLISLAEMGEMVEQTLTYARGVWTREAVESVDARDLLRDLEDEGEHKGVGMRLVLPDAPVMLRLRPATIRRALRNLIDNARRYGGAADAVEITLRAGAQTATIEIADRGPGIPEAELPRMFDPFVRLEASRSRETGGTGLGLSIARSIVQAHGGEVTLLNRPGGGLIARLTLPRPVEAAVEG
ncbi:HAMP domain-containing protein [Paracoccus suum]|uniref:histidine kinase n=1 Tax=Paracoccus suum TaxID=2259340 RepID=A0A344PPA2_9RHOB|nr:HAMP domain-containing protein [Paracoccus suum]